MLHRLAVAGALHQARDLREDARRIALARRRLADGQADLALGAGEARRAVHHEEHFLALIAKPLTVQTPLPAASHIPVEVRIQAVPLGGPRIAAVGIKNRVMLRAKIALQHAHYVVAELAGIDERLEVTAGEAGALRDATAGLGMNTGGVWLVADDADIRQRALFIDRPGGGNQAAAMRIAGVVGVVPAVRNRSAERQFVVDLLGGNYAGMGEWFAVLEGIRQ